MKIRTKMTTTAIMADGGNDDANAVKSFIDFPFRTVSTVQAKNEYKILIKDDSIVRPIDD